MIKRIGKVALICFAAGTLVSVSIFGGTVFGETTLGGAKEQQTVVSTALNKSLASQHEWSPELKEKIRNIKAAESEYIESLKQHWSAAEAKYEGFSPEEREALTLEQFELSIRNELLRESHQKDAQMLPLFKDLRQYLRAQNLSSEVADLLEAHFEASKRAMILYEIPMKH